MHKRLALAATALTLIVAAGAAAADDTPAKALFSKAEVPAPLAPRPVGSYARGCMAGAVALPIDGPAWQVMRLSRNRNWGTPRLVAFLERLAREARAHDGWPGLLVGDMSQPRGGPMSSGHASHQIGLDADVWLTPMPDRRLTYQEREEISAVTMLKDGVREVDPAKWSDSRFRLIRRAASYPEVARIFVHPAIKKVLCESAGTNRDWLRKIRPWWGHHYHFHIRLECPAGVAGCTNQAPPPPGDGCGAELASWFAPEKWEPAPPPKKPVKPPPEITLADLPNQCTTILNAVAPPIPPDRPSGSAEDPIGEMLSR